LALLTVTVGIGVTDKVNVLESEPQTLVEVTTPVVEVFALTITAEFVDTGFVQLKLPTLLVADSETEDPAHAERVFTLNVTVGLGIDAIEMLDVLLPHKLEI
jgi:hypothetical protein